MISDYEFDGEKASINVHSSGDRGEECIDQGILSTGGSEENHIKYPRTGNRACEGFESMLPPQCLFEV